MSEDPFSLSQAHPARAAAVWKLIGNWFSDLAVLAERAGSEHLHVFSDEADAARDMADIIEGVDDERRTRGRDPLKFTG